MIRVSARKPLVIVALLLTAGTLWASPPETYKAVFLGSGLGRTEVLQFATALAGSGHSGVMLLDSPKTQRPNQRFLEAFQPHRVVRVTWHGGPPAELWRKLFPRADRVMVCTSTDRRLLLHAAWLAGVIKGPLFLALDGPRDNDQLRDWLDHWQTTDVWVIGDKKAIAIPNGLKTRHLADETAVCRAALKHLKRGGPIDTLVVTNPADQGLSDLAPWLAATRRAVLLLTNDAGTNTADLVRTATQESKLPDADNLLLLARPDDVPTVRRGNPIAGKDEFIEMEPLTPEERATYTFATGRLFHADPAFVPLILARQRLLPPDGSPRRAIVASNPGGSLPFLETFSRTTAREFTNRGFETTALFGDAVTAGELRRQLPHNDLFLWEGHHNTLINEFKFNEWDEPLPPSLMILQSCLALTEGKAVPLLERGAVAVVGSSSRIYSATGGAFALAYTDALLYDRQSLGGALRNAKNFLNAYALLKEKRLGESVRLTGANQRSAWAFTLWGDPALRLPLPSEASELRSAVHCSVKGSTVTMRVPAAVSKRSATVPLMVPYRPNGRLAGLIRTTDDERELVPLLFAEVSLPNAPDGTLPEFHCKLADTRHVFCWDERRKVGFLLVMPRSSDEHEIKFRVTWKTEDPANPATQNARPGNN